MTIFGGLAQIEECDWCLFRAWLQVSKNTLCPTLFGGHLAQMQNKMRLVSFPGLASSVTGHPLPDLIFVDLA